MENFSDLEEKKTEIITRFFSRPKVCTYFTKLKDNNSEWISDIKGVGQEVKEDITELFELFGILEFYIEEELKVDHTTWWYEMTPLQSDDLDFYLPIFFREFSLYPVSFIRKSKLKLVYFPSSLNFSTPNYSQYRASVPDYCYDTMAMIYCCKERTMSYIKNTIHHEFFHFIDYIEDGKIYGPDPEWDMLNTPDFKYGSGGAMNRVWKPLEDGCRGFLNFYSTTGIEEDKAEIFAHMMNFPRKSKRSNVKL